MGYESSVRIYVRLMPQWVERVREEIKEYNRSHSGNETLIGEEDPDEGDFRDYFFGSIYKIENDGSIILTENYGKWYNDSDFAQWIKDKCQEGTIEFKGEGDEEWGYDFDGFGNCYTLIYKTERGELLLTTHEIRLQDKLSTENRLRSGGKIWEA